MIYTLSYYYVFFFIYSVIGYFCEVCSVSRHNKKLVLSRGYLIGPYLPIFGFGGLFISLLLTKYSDDYLTLFVMGMFLCCFLEYFTSYFMEKIFHLRWWDYHYRKFNINGRICLETGILFGVGSILMIHLFNPIIFSFLDFFTEEVLISIAIFLFAIQLIDFFISTFTIIRLKIDTSSLSEWDSTQIVREKVFESLQRYRYFYNRFLKAFPKVKTDQNMALLDKILKKGRISKGESKDEK